MPPHGHQVTEFAFETIIRRGVLAQKDGPMHVRVGRQGATDRIAFLIHHPGDVHVGVEPVPWVAAPRFGEADEGEWFDGGTA